MSRKQTMLNMLRSSVPKCLKNVIPMNIRNWIGNQLDYGITFDGWGMKNCHELPWNGGVGNETFLHAIKDVKEHFDFSGDDGVNLSNIDDLMWRHWIVSYCVRHAVEFTDKDLPMVECGVCDGLTAYFVLRELRGLGSHANMHLYDAWAPMKCEYLLESEQQSAGHYSNISMERVKKNLSKFENVAYHIGYIPESLNKEPSSPDKISYLSIDLNSSIPTVAALEYFFPRLARGGSFFLMIMAGLVMGLQRKLLTNSLTINLEFLCPSPQAKRFTIDKSFRLHALDINLIKIITEVQ